MIHNTWSRNKEKVKVNVAPVPKPTREGILGSNLNANTSFAVNFIGYNGVCQ
jgi:hypothetical protein